MGSGYDEEWCRLNPARTDWPPVNTSVKQHLNGSYFAHIGGDADKDSGSFCVVMNLDGKKKFKKESFLKKFKENF